MQDSSKSKAEPSALNDDSDADAFAVLSLLIIIALTVAYSIG